MSGQDEEIGSRVDLRSVATLSHLALCRPSRQAPVQVEVLGDGGVQVHVLAAVAVVVAAVAGAVLADWGARGRGATRVVPNGSGGGWGREEQGCHPGFKAKEWYSSSARDPIVTLNPVAHKNGNSKRASGILQPSWGQEWQL